MNEHTHGKDVLDALSPLTTELRSNIPDVRTKELIAMAIGVVEQCDGCIASHARGAARAGATTQQAAEAIGVTFLMNGGPATIYGPRAYAAFCEFAERYGKDAPTR